MHRGLHDLVPIASPPMSLLQWLSDGSLARGSRGRLSRRKQSDGRATASSTTAVMSADEEGRRSRGAGGTAFSRAKSRPRRTLPNLRSIFTRRHLRRGPLHVGSRRKQLGPRGRLHRCVVAPNPSSSGCHPARSAGLRPPLCQTLGNRGRGVQLNVTTAQSIATTMPSPAMRPPTYISGTALTAPSRNRCAAHS